jgi:general secretion pathway protein B
MSFILDALKKSENERQRHQGPSLADVPQRRPANERPAGWVFVVIALLVLNLIVFLVVLLRKHDAPAVTPADTQSVTAASVEQSAPPTPAPPPNATMSSPTARDPAVRSLAEEAGVADVDDEDDFAAAMNPDLAAAAEVPAGRPPIVSPIQGPTTTPVRTPQSFRNEDREDEHLPTIHDVAARGTQLPSMHLDIHVYANSPAERFVFINMKKYREGDTTADGLHLEKIRRDGVVLNHQGTRFLLPRN